MGIYRDLVRVPGVVRILLSQLTARFPFGMLSITVLLHIQLTYGNYTAAGVVLAAQSVGQAVAGPLTSRLMGRLGMRRVLLVTSIVCASLLALIAFTTFPLPVVATLAAVIGITTPPITPAVRTIYPKLVSGNQVTPLFSLDASAQEIIWVIGPVVAVFVSTQLGTVWGLLIAAAFMLAGGVWFISSPQLRELTVPPARKKFGAVLTRPTVILASIIGFFFLAAFAALEAGIVAAFGHSGAIAGLILAIYSVGSIFGGFMLGHREIRPWSIAARTLIVLAGTALCLVSLNPVWLGVVLLFGGIGVAPVFASIFSVVSATVRFSETAEAYGWVGTGQLVGAALGSAVAGIAIDGAGGTGAIFVSTLFMIATTLTAVIGVKWLPDLRGKDATPIPDTVTIPIQLNG